jgi:hypothetical protein
MNMYINGGRIFGTTIVHTVKDQDVLLSLYWWNLYGGDYPQLTIGNESAFTGC